MVGEGAHGVGHIHSSSQDPDPDRFGYLDPDPHRDEKKLDPDPPNTDDYDLSPLPVGT